MFQLRPLAALALLMLSVPAGAQSGEWSSARPLTLGLSNFRFDPAEIRLQHGVPYRLHLVNGASGGHDFAAKAFFAAVRIRPEDGAKVKNGRVEVDGGESVDIMLIAPSPGTYKVHCTHFMHSAFGMTGTIIVQ